MAATVEIGNDTIFTARIPTRAVNIATVGYSTAEIGVVWSNLVHGSRFSPWIQILDLVHGPETP